jgi:hypothetical protein
MQIDFADRRAHFISIPILFLLAFITHAFTKSPMNFKPVYNLLTSIQNQMRGKTFFFSSDE